MTNISLPEKIFIYGVPVDMRCSFDGLFSLVHSKLEEDPASGSLFLFINRRGNYLKGLIWDRTGFMIIAKRLEHGRFRIRNKARKVVIERSQLRKLLDGIAVGGFQIPRSKDIQDGPSHPSQTDDARGYCSRSTS